MPGTIWIEVLFNTLYLIIIWILVLRMSKRLLGVTYSRDIKVAEAFYLAFLFLAIGDTGHVGFRVFAYLFGGLEKNAFLIGVGSLATAVTITFFYMFMLMAWKHRFNRNYGLLGYLLFTVAVVRLIVLLLPANDWSSINAPFEMSLYRNILLTIQGLGAATLIYIDSAVNRDKTFEWLGIMIFLSFICYVPVILFVQKIPVIGMLMIPKTVAYMTMAVLVYRNIFYRRLGA